MSLPRIINRVESSAAILAVLIMAFLPVIDLTQRNIYGRTIIGASGLVEHLTLWVAFLGAAIATRTDGHLKFAAINRVSGADRVFGVLNTFLSAAVSFGLFVGALVFVQVEMESPSKIAGLVPIWMISAILPVAFALITARFVWLSGSRLAAVAGVIGIALSAALGFAPTEWVDQSALYIIVLLIIGGLLGAPIFVVIGGASLILFHAQAISVAAISIETYRIVTSPLVPAIPLFTLTGYILSQGNASNRLIDLFRALFAWMPGGLVIATTLICAFFSSLTGASGVTILALAPLLLPILMSNGFSEKFSMGLITSTGSIGLLFPPSLAVIMYAVVAKLPVTDLFIAGFIPGVLMVAAVGAIGLINDPVKPSDRPKFDLTRALAGLWRAKWELALPPFVIFAIFTGYATLIEAAAITVVYSLFIQIIIHRELNPFRELGEIAFRSVTLTGGVFIILGVALGLNNYFVDAGVPTLVSDWVSENIDSKVQFLLLLNATLIVVGALMDITSAIIVMVPLILPISQLFGVHPLHLAVIFLVNLELGYLTPPVGMNLFLASYRFEKPLSEIYFSTLLFFAVLLAILALVTFAPFLVIGAR